MKKMSKIELQRIIVKANFDYNSIQKFIDNYYQEDLKNIQDDHTRHFFENRIEFLKSELDKLLPNFTRNIAKFDKSVDLFNYFINDK